MAVTHADLLINSKKGLLGGRRATIVMILCTTLGLLVFACCLISETTRSQVLWEYSVGSPWRSRHTFSPYDLQCIYTNTGRTALACASGALVALVLAMTVNQFFTGITLCSPSPSDTVHRLTLWTSSSLSTSSLRWQAAAFFVFSWISFAVAAVLLLIGIAVEASHFVNRQTRHSQCLVVRQGLFAGAGVFSLACISLGVAFYVAALHTVRMEERERDSGERYNMAVTATLDGGMDEVPTASLEIEPPGSNPNSLMKMKLPV
ncbi:hypothetical protein O6H91_20G039200 [Diphasiastrum complanatum]|uniref:Uncharacterized protein n=1 Tax=Diphasiastrum complanatum TaxID=34168 RepID=A0ACC2APR0_DIPCM|nr:hypothetical protein O6H91_20G039200 [Diphasiastrum complanatum]